MNTSNQKQRPSRRAILKGLAGLAAATVAAATTGVADAGYLLKGRPFRKSFGKVIVYRLRTRGTKACRACQLHHRFIIFRSRILADTNRAHVGCNCPIVTQEISKARFRMLFPRGSKGVARLRRGYV